MIKLKYSNIGLCVKLKMVHHSYMGTHSTIENFFDIEVCDIECKSYQTRVPNVSTCDNDRMIYNSYTNEFYSYDSNAQIYSPLKSTNLHIIKPYVPPPPTSSNDNTRSSNISPHNYNYYCVDANKITNATIEKNSENDKTHEFKNTTYYCPSSTLGFRGMCFKNSFLDENIVRTCISPEASNMENCIVFSNQQYQYIGESADAHQYYKAKHPIKYGDRTFYCTDCNSKVMSYNNNWYRCIPFSLFTQYLQPLSKQPCQTTYGKDCWLQPVVPPATPSNNVCTLSNASSNIN